jgi:hypothetical protein
VHIPLWLFGVAGLACVYLLVYWAIRRLGARFERWLTARRRETGRR